MPEFSLTCFGVGDGWPSVGRDHSSFLYRFKDQAMLIDCGEPVSRNFKASGLDYNLIDHILLSHLHFDHLGGFFMLLQGFWLEKRHSELGVHLPADGISPIRQLLHAGCIFEDLLPFRMRFEALQIGKPIPGRGLRITPFGTSHLWGLRDLFQVKYPQQFEAFSFLIEAGPLRLAHSADIGAVEDLTPLVEAPLDLLVCELAHVQPEDLFRFLQGRDIGQILFVHLSRECLHNLAQVQALAGEMLGPDRIGWAQGGQQFTFGSDHTVRNQNILAQSPSSGAKETGVHHD
jgi:hypothetical protein